MSFCHRLLPILKSAGLERSRAQGTHKEMTGHRPEDLQLGFKGTNPLDMAFFVRLMNIFKELHSRLCEDQVGNMYQQRWIGEGQYIVRAFPWCWYIHMLLLVIIYIYIFTL